MGKHIAIKPFRGISYYCSARGLGNAGSRLKKVVTPPFVQPNPVTAQGQQLQLKQTSDATSLLRLCCRSSACHSGKRTLDVQKLRETHHNIPPQKRFWTPPPNL